MYLELLQIRVDDLFAAVGAERSRLGSLDGQTVWFHWGASSRGFGLAVLALDLHFLGDRHCCMWL